MNRIFCYKYYRIFIIENSIYILYNKIWKVKLQIYRYKKNEYSIYIYPSNYGKFKTRMNLNFVF